jgi:hypothetical protein
MEDERGRWSTHNNTYQGSIVDQRPCGIHSTSDVPLLWEFGARRDGPANSQFFSRVCFETFLFYSLFFNVTSLDLNYPLRHYTLRYPLVGRLFNSFLSQRCSRDQAIISLLHILMTHPPCSTRLHLLPFPLNFGLAFSQ